jgi:MFS family permease
MLFIFAALFGSANGIMTIIRGTAVPEFLWREGYGAINGALAFPSMVAQAGAPLAAALIWSMSGSYHAVLWTVLAVASVAAGAFWLAARLAERPRRQHPTG